MYLFSPKRVLYKKATQHPQVSKILLALLRFTPEAEAFPSCKYFLPI